MMDFILNKVLLTRTSNSQGRTASRHLNLLANLPSDLKNLLNCIGRFKGKLVGKFKWREAVLSWELEVRAGKLIEGVSSSSLTKSYLIFFAIALLSSCQDKPTGPPKTPPQKVEKARTTKKETCQPQGKVLEHNQKLVKDEHTLICITADATTHDQQFGDSHRVLEVYDTRTCKVINREVLPVNMSPDYPYYIADIIFNKNSHLVAIKGFGNVYCYDTKGQKLLKPLVPEYINERVAQDAQSGQVKHLEVWENYLIGYASDLGGFVFDLSDVAHPKALKPAIEYDLSDGEGEAFSSLFFLKSENENTYQAIVPFYDNEEMKFNVNTLFKVPKFVSPFIPKNNSDNRFVVIRTQEKPSQTIVVDMNKQSQLEVPKDVSSQKAQAILDWLRKNK